MVRYNVIGTMSGTSLDGLDIAHCNFEFSDNEWSYEINKATTVNFQKNLVEKLKYASKMNGLDLMKLHNELGNFIGLSINNFISENNTFFFSFSDF